MPEIEKPKDRKIRVEFEMDPEDVRKLVEGGSRGPERLSDEELEKLIKEDTIKAANFLDEEQMNMNTKFLGKIFSKTASKFSNKQTQKVVVAEATNIFIDKVSDKSFISESQDKADRPKE